MKAPVGALVSLYYDSPRPVEVGDALRTDSGRLYLVQSVRIQARGKHRGRKHLKCIVGTGTEAVAGVIHPLVWYPRGRNRSRAIQRSDPHA